jgi:hypothetical protein
VSFGTRGFTTARGGLVCRRHHSAAPRLGWRTAVSALALRSWVPRRLGPPVWRGCWVLPPRIKHVGEWMGGGGRGLGRSAGAAQAAMKRPKRAAAQACGARGPAPSTRRRRLPVTPVTARSPGCWWRGRWSSAWCLGCIGLTVSGRRGSRGRRRRRSGHLASGGRNDGAHPPALWSCCRQRPAQRAVVGRPGPG